MSRGISGAMQSAASAGHVPMLVLVELDFASGFVRLNNSAQSFTHDGNNYIGLGYLSSIDVINEGATLEARGLSMRLSGVDSDFIAIALGEDYQGRSCKVWIALLSDTFQIITSPVLAFWGRMDTMDVMLGEESAITLNAESRLADWDRSRTRRFNHEDQQIDYPGDKGFEFVPQMVEKELRWGY